MFGYDALYSLVQKSGLLCTLNMRINLVIIL